MRRDACWTWIRRSRSAATASATAARRSASANCERRVSTSIWRVLLTPFWGASEGVSRGVAWEGMSGGVVTRSIRPTAIKAVTGICHPFAVCAAPYSASSSRFLRMVDTETPQTLAASASPITGAFGWGVMTGCSLIGEGSQGASCHEITGGDGQGVGGATRRAC